jgi:hypothetical protein
VGTQQPNLIDEIKARIDTELGKKIAIPAVVCRGWQKASDTCAALSVVEPVFASICMHKRMNRVTLRTKSKIDVQWGRTRFALVHNIGKTLTFGAIH